MLLTARFVIPVEGPPMEGGAVSIRDGRIAEIGSALRTPSHPTVDYGDAVILPAFVNAHTHFELSFLAGRVPPSGDFVDWLRRLVQTLATQSPIEEEVQASVRTSIDQSLSAGVTTVGDITRWPAWTRAVLADSPLRAMSFGEVIAFGRRRSQLTDRLQAAGSRTFQTRRVRCGISPHSPYTVEPDALAACARRAKENDAHLCIHLAESIDEEEFTQNGSGPLAAFMQTAGVWDDSFIPAKLRPVDLCHASGVLGTRTLLAHANYVNDDDLSLIAQSGSSVAYCPRTHAAFGHAPHRFRDMLRAGINVCVGTDSLASNPSLSILDELRFLHQRHPDFDAVELIAMGTLRGAPALGFNDVGSLSPGKAADLVVVPLNRGANTWTDILESNAAPLAVFIDGVQTSFRG